MGITVRRVKLDAGGYDDTGRYWGTGKRLYYCPEIVDIKGASFYNDAHTRADDNFAARDVFEQTMERLKRAGTAK